MSANALPRRAAAGRRLRAPSLRTMLMVVIPALIATAGLLLYLGSGRYVGTDNAAVAAQKVLITPEVSGKVIEVAVRDNQIVRTGDLLYRIDSTPFGLAVERAEAKLAAAGQAHRSRGCGAGCASGADR